MSDKGKCRKYIRLVNDWVVPRKPTVHSRKAREALVALAASCAQEEALPPLRVLSERYDIHAATVFRILRDLVAEGIYWQSPSGRFLPVAARRKTLRGRPVCFIGREMWQWSRLYQELLAGVSEVCSTNGSPLVLLASTALVRQTGATEAPEFGSAKAQIKELEKLAEVVPRGCAGYLFDHLWSEAAMSKVKFSGGEKVQLIFGNNSHAEAVAPDYLCAAEMAADYAMQHSFAKIGLFVPFTGDPAIDHSVGLLRQVLARFSPMEMVFGAAPDRKTIRQFLDGLDLVVCREDNVALALAEILEKGDFDRQPILLATQGTGAIRSPHARLRLDYRRLGRAAASRLLYGTKVPSQRPTLVIPEQSM